jgi:hypothetical protein
MFKTYYIIFFLLSSCLVSFGQLKKGDNYVSKNMYVEAIKRQLTQRTQILNKRHY